MTKAETLLTRLQEEFGHFRYAYNEAVSTQLPDIVIIDGLKVD